MTVLLNLSHQILNLSCRASLKKFQKNASQLEQIQRAKLSHILKLKGQKLQSYEDFAQQFKVTRYADWKDKIEQSRSSRKNELLDSPIIRFQPTSGSSDALKFIPYTQDFLNELDQAITTWLSSLYFKYPKLKSSTHYWSVSWLPESQRSLLENENLNDDSALLNFSKRVLGHFTQSVPADIALAQSAESAMFATIVYLVADENLGFISVWSPTFALQLLDLIEEHRLEIYQVLRTQRWTRSDLSYLKVPKNYAQAEKLLSLDFSQKEDWSKLWNKLTLISSWDTSSAKQWATKLRGRLPSQVSFEGKGLWATEGVVTIPVLNHYPLSYHSHFYEFVRASDDQIVPSWVLQQDDIVSPIITTGSGLIRYQIDDELRVSEFMHGIPCFEFLGRKMTVDMVGEKLDHATAIHLIDTLKTSAYQPISLLGVENSDHKKPFYVLLSQGDENHKPEASKIDQILKQNFHYELARNLGQLDEPEVIHVNDAWEFYRLTAMKNGMIEGNIKPEPLKKMKTI